MINKMTFHKLLGSIAGLVLWALVAAQLANAHPVRCQIASHQHDAKATTVAFEELAATLNTGRPAMEDKSKLLTFPKLSKALAELVEHYNISPSQDDDGGEDEATACSTCSCTKGSHNVLCNWVKAWCRVDGGHWCPFGSMSGEGDEGDDLPAAAPTNTSVAWRGGTTALGVVVFSWGDLQ